MDVAWRAAFDAHLANLSRASYVAPYVIGTASASLLVVCPPWRYDHVQFAHDVAGWMHAPERTVVVLPAPFVHADGGREWWAYGDGEGADAALAAHDLAYADACEVRASVGAVSRFLDLVSTAQDVVLFGSSQGGTLAAHVGVEAEAACLRRVFALQPAGIYGDLWRPCVVGVDVVEEVVDGFGHGDMAQWRGRLVRVRRGVRTVLLSTSTDDGVAPPRTLVRARTRSQNVTYETKR